MIILIDRWTLALKNGGKWSFSYETKALIHLSQRVEKSCGAQSIKERKLLHESVFTTFNRWTLIQKKEGSEVFLIKQKRQFIYPNKENEFMEPNH